MAEDDYGESYYYRGIADNWLSFAGFYWRIIRINGDGSIRLIYSGTKDNHTGEGTKVDSSAYKANYRGEKYADYRISTVKYKTDNWYKTNILAKDYENKVADTGYCNDLTKYSTTDFGSQERLRNNKIPTLKCPDKENNLLSTANAKLTYSVGLLTQDEASFEGGVYSNVIPNENKKYYLYSGYWYWTMTPAVLGGSSVFVGNVISDGCLGNYSEDYSGGGIRPVLSLKSKVNITSGDGTEANPYIVE